MQQAISWTIDSLRCLITYVVSVIEANIKGNTKHYDDVIMSTIASQITSLTIVYSTIYSGADQSKHQSSASLAFVWGIHRGPVNSPHKWPVTQKMFPFDDVIMKPASLAVCEEKPPVAGGFSSQRSSNARMPLWVIVIKIYHLTVIIPQIGFSQGQSFCVLFCLFSYKSWYKSNRRPELNGECQPCSQVPHTSYVITLYRLTIYALKLLSGNIISLYFSLICPLWAAW